MWSVRNSFETIQTKYKITWCKTEMATEIFTKTTGKETDIHRGRLGPMFWHDRSCYLQHLHQQLITSSTLSPECQLTWKVTNEEKVGTIPGSKTATSVALSSNLQKIILWNETYKMQKDKKLKLHNATQTDLRPRKQWLLDLTFAYFVLNIKASERTSSKPSDT